MRMQPIYLALALTTLSSLAGASASEPIRRGEPIGASPKVALSEVLAQPQDHTASPIVTEGVIQKVCQKKGCWMELAPKAGEAGMRVTFKGYSFFVPTDSEGRQATVEGKISVQKLSPADVEHLMGEGVKLIKNADGSANEVSFEAAGVELRAGTPAG
jgi:Domain of unknown function (DUF4920)